MTLIVSLLTPDFLIQVGDTRVVRPLSNGEVQLIDDYRNKLTYYDGRAVFGYCGLACLENLRTDQWITRELSQRTFASDAHAVQFLANRAQDAVAATSLAPEHRKLAIVGLGWVSGADQRTQYSASWHISNFHTGDGTVLRSPSDQFVVVTRTPQRNEPAVLSLSGWKPQRALVDAIERRLSRDVRKSGDPFQLLTRVVAWIRECANASGGLVGRNLLSVYIPRRADATAIRLGPGQPVSLSLVTTDSSGKPISLMVGGQPAEAAVFHFWPEQAESQPCGPNFAVPGKGEVLSAMSGFLGMASQISMPSTAQSGATPTAQVAGETDVRFELLPSHRRLKPADHLTITCRISGIRAVPGRYLASYELVVLWNVKQLEFHGITWGAELGGPEFSERLWKVLAPGKFNPSDPSFAAVVFSERTLLDMADLHARQSDDPVVAKLRFSCLTEGPIRLKPGFPKRKESLVDSAGRRIERAWVRALVLNAID